MRNMEDILAELQNIANKFDEMKLTRMDDIALGDDGITEEMNNLVDTGMTLTSEQIKEMQIGKIPVNLIERRIDDLETIRQRATKLKKEVLDVELGGDYYPDDIAKFNEKYEVLYTQIDVAFRALARVSTVKTEAYMDLKQQLMDAKKAREACKYELERHQEEKQRIENLQADLQKQIADLEGQLERISGATVEGVEAERVYADQKTQIEGNLETLKNRLAALGTKLPEVEAEIEKAEAALRDAEEKVAGLEAEVRKEKEAQELAEKIRNERQERIQREREPVGIFDVPSGRDDDITPDRGTSPDGPDMPGGTPGGSPSGSDSGTPSGSSNGSASGNGSGTTGGSTGGSGSGTPTGSTSPDGGSVVSDSDDLLPIGPDETIEIIDGKEYILIIDIEATMQEYRNSGYGKNADGEYFNPNIDEYDKDYDPTKDPLFQIFIYYEVVKVINIEATMQEYRNSGYGKNADGEYFNPNIDEYDKDYDPTKDPLFQVFEKKKKYVGKGPRGKVPTNGREEPKPTPKPKDPEEKKVTHEVTINITGPNDKKNSGKIMVEDGKVMFDNPENQNYFKNMCNEFGGGSHTIIEGVTVNGKPFDYKNTPITEPLTVDFTISRKHKVTFIDENNEVASLYVEDGRYLDPNQVEIISRAVNYQNPDAGYLGQPKDMREGNALKRAFTGLKYWGIAGSNPDEKPEKFKFNQPISGDITLTAHKGVKGKSIAATMAGLAAGAAIDLVGGPVAGKIAMGAAGLGDRIAKYKLNHHKEMRSYEEIEQMTGIRKASAKLANHFRKTQTIKDLQYFLRGLMIGASAVEIGRATKNVVERIIDSKTPQPTPGHTGPQQTGPQQTGPQQTGPQQTGPQGGGNGGTTPQSTSSTPTLKNGDAFEYGYRDSYNAVSGTNDVHLYTDLTKDAVPTHFYDTVNRQWLPINDQTLAQVASNPGQYAVRYMNGNGVDMMWENAVDALESVGGVAR